MILAVLPADSMEGAMFDWLFSDDKFLMTLRWGILALILLWALIRLFGPAMARSDVLTRKEAVEDDQQQHEMDMESRILEWGDKMVVKQVSNDRLKAKLMLEAMKEPDSLERQLLFDHIDKHFPATGRQPQSELTPEKNNHRPQEAAGDRTTRIRSHHLFCF